MPLTIDVGLSRKASHDYQSAGVSINIAAELDQVLLARPDDLQRQIAYLYGQARRALDAEAGVPPGTQPSRKEHDKDAGPPPDQRGPHNGNNGNGRNGDGRNGDGHAPDPNGNRRTPAPMTTSQRRAIEAIARDVGVDPYTECRRVLQASLNELHIRQASRLIDHLRALQPAGGRDDAH